MMNYLKLKLKYNIPHRRIPTDKCCGKFLKTDRERQKYAIMCHRKQLKHESRTHGPLINANDARLLNIRSLLNKDFYVCFLQRPPIERDKKVSTSFLAGKNSFGLVGKFSFVSF